MGLFGNKKSTIRCYQLKHKKGIPNIKPDKLVDITINADNKTITFLENTWFRKNASEASLDINKIVNIQVYASGETYKVITKKSHKARNTILGGVVAGPVGALVGVHTGDEKSVTKEMKNIIIEYESDNGIQNLVFSETQGQSGMAELMESFLNESMGSFIDEKNITL